MHSNNILIVGANGVGKKSFAIALGATELVKNAQERPQFRWQLPGHNGHKEIFVHILRTTKEILNSDHGVVVVLFNLMRRDSLKAVRSQWAHVVDIIGRRLMLVGTHADCTCLRKISSSEVREFAGDFDGYEEVCCRPGDSSMVQVQIILKQWATSGLASIATDIPLARASICSGFPRSVVTMMMPNTTCCLSACSTDQRRRADLWLYDSKEDVCATPVATGADGDLKLRTISKAIYDIRGAVAEKSKALAKYRDRQVSHWLTRSRYFGPTESSRHKRWQKEQKKHQLTQSHLHHLHASTPRQRSSAHDFLREQNLRSTSHSYKAEPPSKKSTARRGPASPGRELSSHCIDHEKSLSTSLENTFFIQPTESTKQQQRQLETGHAQEQMKRLRTKRVLRKKQRAASNDMFERSTRTAAAYLDCYDEMDMPPQLQPISPSLCRKMPLSIMSPASSSRCNSFKGNCKLLEAGILDPSGRHSFESLSLANKQVGCLSTSLPTTMLPVSASATMTSAPSTPSSQAPSNRSRRSVDVATLDNFQYGSFSDELDAPDKLQTECKALHTTATDKALSEPIRPLSVTLQEDLVINETSTSSNFVQ